MGVFPPFSTLPEGRGWASYVDTLLLSRMFYEPPETLVSISYNIRFLNPVVFDASHAGWLCAERLIRRTISSASARVPTTPRIPCNR